MAQRQSRGVHVLLLLLLQLLPEESCMAAEYPVNWTAEGISQYRETPLKVMFGDTMKILCDAEIRSNYIFVETEEQYMSCNSSINDGFTLAAGDCPGMFQIPPKTFTQTVQRLSGEGQTKVIEYRAGSNHYFYSSLNGESEGVTDVDNRIFIGGQCLDGHKMIVRVLDDTKVDEVTPSPSAVTPTETMTTGGTGGNTDNSNDISLPFIIGVIIAGLVALIILVVVSTIFVCVIKKNKQKKVFITQSQMESAQPFDDNDNKNPTGIQNLEKAPAQNSTKSIKVDVANETVRFGNNPTSGEDELNGTAGNDDSRMNGARGGRGGGGTGSGSTRGARGGRGRGRGRGTQRVAEQKSVGRTGSLSSGQGRGKDSQRGRRNSHQPRGSSGPGRGKTEISRNKRGSGSVTRRSSDGDSNPAPSRGSVKSGANSQTNKAKNPLPPIATSSTRGHSRTAPLPPPSSSDVVSQEKPKDTNPPAENRQVKKPTTDRFESLSGFR